MVLQPIVIPLYLHYQSNYAEGKKNWRVTQNKMNLITKTNFDRKFTTIAILKEAVKLGLAIEERKERFFKGFYSGTDYTYKTTSGELIYSCSNMAGFGLNTWDSVELNNGIYSLSGTTDKLTDTIGDMSYQLFHLYAEAESIDPKSDDAAILRGKICTIESKLKRLEY